MKKGILVIVFLLFVFLSTAQATLFDRGPFAYDDGAGNIGFVNLIYDDDYDITWVGHGNFAQSSGFDADGLMNWNTAGAWASGLTIGGFMDWRLPTALNPDGTGPESGWGNGSELSHLFYGELGGTVNNPITTSLDPDLGLFPHLQILFAYWTGTANTVFTEGAWFFIFNNGSLSWGNKNDLTWAMAVRTGDVVPPDTDDDGFSPPDDCDDNDNTVYPDAPELCDGKDNDCDGSSDEDAGPTYYFDFDEDGYGDPTISTQACVAPQGYVEDNTDCDDNDPNKHPSQTWFKDADDDGFWDGTPSITSCARPTGYKIISELIVDCNDNCATCYPGAIDIPNNGVDEDCNDVVDDNARCDHGSSDDDSSDYKKKWKKKEHHGDGDSRDHKKRK